MSKNLFRNNKFLDELMESARQSNLFKTQLAECYANQDKDKFIELTTNYLEKELKESKNLEASEKDIKIQLIKYICSSFIDFSTNKSYQSSNLPDYCDILSRHLNPSILTFLTWHIGEKEYSMELMRTHKTNKMNKARYGFLFDTLNLGALLNFESMNEKSEIKKEYLQAIEKGRLYQKINYKLNLKKPKEITSNNKKEFKI